MSVYEAENGMTMSAHLLQRSAGLNFSERSATGKFTPNIMLIYLFSLRSISEGIDRMLGSPLSIITSALIVIASIYGTLKIGRIQKNLLFISSLGLIFIISSLISVFANISTDPGQQFAQVLKYLSYISVFWYVSSTRFNRFELRYLAVAITAITSIEVPLALYQVISGTGFKEFDYGTSRAYGFSSHPVFLSIKMAAFLFLMQAIKPFATRSLMRFFYVAWALSIGLTFSRTGWIMIMFLPLFVILKSRSWRLKAVTLMIGVPSILMLFVLSGRFDDLSSIPQFISQGSYRKFDPATIASSADWRLLHWYTLINIGLEHPILGFGPSRAPDLSIFTKNAHNSFIDVFVEQGFVGLFAFASFLTVIPTTLSRTFRKAVYSSIERTRLETLGSATFFSFLLGMTFGASIFDQTMSMLAFFLIVGILLNISFLQLLSENGPRRALPIRHAQV